MVLACFRHPSTLSLGVLAPKFSFGDGNNAIGSNGVVGDDMGAGGIGKTAMRLAALSSVEVLVRLLESLLTSTSIKEGHFFGFVIDGIFLAWMLRTLYQATIRTIGQDYGRGYAWSKSRDLKHYWILYSIFVSFSLIESLVGTLQFVTNIFPVNEHSQYSIFKLHGLNDLFLLTGIAFFLRPKPLERTAFAIGLEDEFTAGLEADGDYALLLEEDDGGQGSVSDEEGLMTSGFEMTSNLTTQAETAALS